MKKCPCKDCSDRHASCHADCEKYKGWRAEYDALRSEAQPKTNAEKNYKAENMEIACSHDI